MQAAPPYIAGIATVVTLLRNDSIVSCHSERSEESPGRVVFCGDDFTVAPEGWFAAELILRILYDEIKTAGRKF